MINVMHSLSKPMNEVEKSLDPQLWHACAGGMAQIPLPHSKVYYFPQGHAEHANKTIDFLKFPRVPPLILCRVVSIKYLADPESDEVFARIRLMPLRENEQNECDEESGFLGVGKNDERDKTNSFAKTLTQSDANNGGGFSVPRYCAETIFPKLDYSSEPPVQTILAKDVHGVVWKFRHIYRGTPRRHLLTTGWSNFVSQKKLIAGDSIVFLRADNGDLCVGMRRAKRGIGGGACGWNIGAWGGGVSSESVVEAARLAGNGECLEVEYYPRAGTPEFVVAAEAVASATRVGFCGGMRFKMAFETEDSSRISWFMGTISCVSVDHPIHWPNSPWRILQVVWDEPDLLQNVKRVNPWLVELVSTMAAGHHSPFSPPRKRPRLPQPPELPDPFGQLRMQTLVSNTLGPSSPLCGLHNNFPAGIQGARHAQFDLKLLDYAGSLVSGYPPNYEPLSCSLKMGSPAHELKKNEGKTPMFLLFGQPILTAEQMSQSHSVDTEGNGSNGSGSVVVQNCPPEASDGAFPGFGSDNGQCKGFVEFEDAGRNLALAMVASTPMLGMERSEMGNIRYTDARWNDRHVGDEPFSDFIKNARRLRILTDSSSVNL